jgi:hypothetical protein
MRLTMQLTEGLRHGRRTTGPIIDTGTQSVIVQGAGVAMPVDVASVNPGSVVARGQCLAVAIGSAAASGLGNLLTSVEATSFVGGGAPRSRSPRT